MATRKRFKRFARRRRFKRSSHSLAKKVKKIEKTLRARAPEVKHIYGTTASVSTVAPTTGLTGVKLTPTIVEGTADTERIGDVIHLKSWKLTWTVTHLAASFPEKKYIRLLIVQQKSITAVAAQVPVFGDLCEQPTRYDSPLVIPKFRKNFHILQDRIYTLQLGEFVVDTGEDPLDFYTARNSTQIVVNLRPRIRKIRFTTAAGDVLRGGEIFWFMSVFPPTNLPVQQMLRHLQFTDI
jgi:hypothetical protein